MPKPLTKSKRDNAVRIALQYVAEGVLEDVKEKEGVEKIVRETEQTVENKADMEPMLIENKSSEFHEANSSEFAKDVEQIHKNATKADHAIPKKEPNKRQKKVSQKSSQKAVGGESVSSDKKLDSAKFSGDKRLKD